MTTELYKPFVNTTKSNYKYFVNVKSDNKKGFKKIGFGNKKYQQFKDKLGHYKNLDHNDKERRNRYLKRARGIKNKEGKLTYKDKNSSNYWSISVLW
jgi:hypothetical protein